MYCKNCGFPLNGNQTCPSCGATNESTVEQTVEPVATPVAPVQNVEQAAPAVTTTAEVVQNVEPVQPETQVQTPPVNAPEVTPIQQINEVPVQPSVPEPKKSNTGLIVLIIVLGLAVIGLGIFIAIKVLGPNNPGPDTNTIDNTKEPIVDNTKEPIDDNTKTPDVELKTVGDSTYGYIDVPSDWYEFHDVTLSNFDGIQYSYANVYIATLYKYEKNQYTSYDYANAMYTKSLSESDVTNVTAEAITAGKSKYKGYLVKMFYPTENSYLYIYYLDDEYGVVHYLSIEGPEKVNDKTLADALKIVDTFRLKK